MNNKNSQASRSKEYTKHPDIKSTIRELAEQRRGGSINIAGLEFQFIYALDMILRLPESPGSAIRLEGIEDVDLMAVAGNHYIQVKTSQNKFDASDFLNLNVLQNFLEIYKLDKQATFRFVHNSSFAKGMMDVLLDRKFTGENINHWRSKLPAILSDEELKDFFQRIEFERIDLKKIEDSVVSALFAKYHVNSGAEPPFIFALFYNVFQWSKMKQTISKSEVQQLFQSVKDSFAVFPENQALKFKWITAVNYNVPVVAKDLSYFEGKAARPSDIARGLPVDRPDWKRKIENCLHKFDVCLIKSSSGQGKSTLAWSVGYSANSKHTIYQIQRCSSLEEVTSIVEFIESRLSIGQYPLVVVDGLSPATAHWHYLAEHFRGYATKFIVTSREEDWKRYGSDVSRLSLDVVDIKLTIQEAKAIFQELKRYNRIHQSVGAWEPVWERISDKGLLIEYVFLLTQGQMIEDRLRHQLKVLGEERDSNAKLEILRLVSLADILSIRVRTSSLVAHLNAETRYETDRNLMFNQLEREYYLKFGNQYVEGLHPIRSRHLVDLSHSNIPVEESLLALLKIVDPEFVYDFFIAAPFYFELTAPFLAEVAAIAAKRSFMEMVSVIDGLMHSEPLRYWLANRDIFDKANAAGGLGMFVPSTVPVNPRNHFEDFVKALGDEAGNLKIHSDLLKRLSPYSFENSAVKRFTETLHQQLNLEKTPRNYTGASLLLRWFHTFGLAFPDVIDLSDEVVLNTIRNRPLNEAIDLVRYYHNSAPEKYQQFLVVHKAEVLGIVREKTSTLAVTENGDINLLYLIDFDTSDINGESVRRIEIFQAFFPGYVKYCTTGEMMPFPNEEIVSYARQSAVKNIAPEHLSDDFNMRINKIWIKVITEQYAAQSSYEWQKFHFEIRNKIVQLLRKCTKLTEAVLEGKRPRALALNGEFVTDGNEYFAATRSRFPFPSHSMRHDIKTFDAEDNKLHSYYLTISNVVQQFLGLIDPKSERDQHLLIVNIKDAIEKLPEMQRAFSVVADASHHYFETAELDQKETASLRRLSETAQFYVYHFKAQQKETIVTAERSVQAWVERAKRIELNLLRRVFDGVSTETGFVFTLPSEVLEAGNLKYLTIGLQNFTLGDEHEAMQLFAGLIGLTDCGIHFFTFVIADVENNVKGAFRISSNFIQRVKQLMEGEADDSDHSTVLPIDVYEAGMLIPAGFVLPPRPMQTVTPHFRLMHNMWKLSEYRSRLNTDNPFDRRWLDRVEKEYIALIKQDFNTLIADGLDVVQRRTIEGFINGRSAPTPTEIVQLILEHAGAQLL